MRTPLGFMSTSGAVVAGVVLVAVLATTMAAGPILFSPGQLNGVSKGTVLGGVATHAQTGSKCGACHTAPWSRTTMADRCMSCHTDVANQIQTRGGLHGKLIDNLTNPTCRGCHADHHGRGGALTVADPTTFPHDLTGYSLQGHRHTARGAQVTCHQCHPNGFAAFDQATCAQCHSQLNPAFMTQHESRFGTNCLACHHGFFRDGSDFDHNMLPFKLLGKHAGLSCSQCHPNTSSIQALQSTPTTCFACHAKNDAHQGQFGTHCEQCHTPSGWQNANFNHAVFPVDHGSQEQRATCKTCHPNGFNTYSCFGCHRHTPANIVAGHEGQSLAALQNCIRCHPGGRAGD